MAGRLLGTSLGFLVRPFLRRSRDHGDRQGRRPPSIISMSVSVTVANTPARPPDLVDSLVMLSSQVGTDGDPPSPVEHRAGDAGRRFGWVSQPGAINGQGNVTLCQ